MNEEEIEPTRVEYLDLVIEGEIDKVKESKSKFGRHYLLKLLARLREEVNWKFADDAARTDAIEKLKAERKKHTRKGKAGRRPGKLKNPTSKQIHYRKFRKDHLHNWDAYLKYCMDNRIPEAEQYSTKDSFNKIKER